MISLIPTPSSLLEQQSWIDSEIKGLGEKLISELTQKAVNQKNFAYCPYSNYPVGVALLTLEGKIYGGCNSERVSYSETDHGEESAITAAVANGAAKKSRKFIKALAIATKDAGVPCGRCRQIMVEHCDNCLILLIDESKEIKHITSLQIMIPFAFTPSVLGK